MSSSKNNTSAATSSLPRTKPISPSNWKYGYDSKGEAKTRVLVTVKDKEGASWVQEYKQNSKKKYFCVGCFIDKRAKNYGEFIGDTFYAPFLHPCSKISAEKNAEDQRKREQKFLKAQEDAAAAAFATSSTTSPPRITPIDASDENGKLDPASINIDSPAHVTPKRKFIASTAKEADGDRSSSSSPLEVLYSTPRIDKPKITNFFNKTGSPSIPKQESSFQSTSVRSHPKLNTTETPTPLKEQQTSKVDEKENKQEKAKNTADSVTAKPGAEPKNRKIKRIALEDDVELILADDGEAGAPDDFEPADDISASATVPQLSQLGDNKNPKADEETVIVQSAQDKSDDNTVPAETNVASATASLRPSTFSASDDAREVDTCDAEYGFNDYGKLKGRLIVREPENRKLAREYTITEATKNWKCLQCNIGIAKKNENGNFYVSTKHECSPISYATIKKDQSIFEAKYRLLLMKQSPSTSSTAATAKPKRKMRKSFLGSGDENDSDYEGESLTTTSTPKSSSILSKLQKLSSSQWEWGCDSAGNEKMRIIVYDQKDRNLVHEYRNGGKKLLCLGCCANGKYVYASRSDDEKNPVISIPPSDKHLCKPRSLEEVREQQKTYEKKGGGRKRVRNDEENDEVEKEETGNNKRSRKSMIFNDASETPANDDLGKRENGNNSENENEESGIFKRSRRSAQIANKRLSSCFNEWGIPEKDNPEDHVNRKIVRRSSRFKDASKSPADDCLIKLNSDANSRDTIEPKLDNHKEVRKSSSILQVEQVSPSAVDQSMDSPSPPSIIAPTAAENEPMNEESKSVNSTVPLPATQISPSSPHSTTVRFFNPSAYEIEECCKKLKLPYFSDAYTFWSKTVIKEILSTSLPNQLYSVVNESSGFACLSLFLTGTETSASLINFNFNQKFFIKNLIEIGKFYEEDLTQLNEKSMGILCSNILTKYHLQALCHFFECRIGIFANGKWERYGSWDDETANILTFLMKKDGDKFCPILSLMQ